MAYKVELRPDAKKAFDKLDKPIKIRIGAAIDEIEAAENPRLLLVPYSGPLAGKWKKRVGDYRLICEIEDAVLTVHVMELKHRSKAYR